MRGIEVMILGKARQLICFIGVVLLSACSSSPEQPENNQATVIKAVPDGSATAEQGKQSLMYRLMVAELAWKQGDTATAVSHYLEAARETRDPEIAERATRMAEVAQLTQQAFTGAKLWVETSPDSVDGRQYLGTLYIRENQPDEAIPHFLKVLELMNDDRKQAYIRIGSQLSKESNQDGVLTVMGQLVQKDAKNAFAFFSFSHVATRFSRFDDALTQVNKALALKPNWPDAVILKARIYQLQKDIDGAVRTFDSALKGKNKNNTGLRMAYGRLLMDAKRMKEARKQYVLLAKHDPDNLDVVYAAALLSLQVEHYKDANKYLKKLVKAKVRTNEATFYLGQVAEKRKQTNKAVKYYTQVQSGEYYLTAQMRIGSILSHQGKYDQALKHVRQIETSNEQDQIQLFLLEGDIMVAAGNFREAFETYDHALNDIPGNNNLLYARAIAAEKLDRLDVVERDLLKIIEADPNHVQALNALGYTLADRTTRYEEALVYIKRALELEPKDAAIIDSMGWIHYRMGNNQAALKYLRQAMSLLSDTEIAAHLGEVLWVSGNKKEAVSVWNSALKDAPNNKIIIDVMRRFGL